MTPRNELVAVEVRTTTSAGRMALTIGQSRRLFATHFPVYYNPYVV